LERSRCTDVMRSHVPVRIWLLVLSTSFRWVVENRSCRNGTHVFVPQGFFRQTASGLRLLSPVPSKKKKKKKSPTYSSPFLAGWESRDNVSPHHVLPSSSLSKIASGRSKHSCLPVLANPFRNIVKSLWPALPPGTSPSRSTTD
jgi:hypothetical protein